MALLADLSPAMGHLAHPYPVPPSRLTSSGRTTNIGAGEYHLDLVARNDVAADRGQHVARIEVQSSAISISKAVGSHEDIGGRSVNMDMDRRALESGASP